MILYGAGTAIALVLFMPYLPTVEAFTFEGTKGISLAWLGGVVGLNLSSSYITRPACHLGGMTCIEGASRGGGGHEKCLEFSSACQGFLHVPWCLLFHVDLQLAVLKAIHKAVIG